MKTFQKIFSTAVVFKISILAFLLSIPIAQAGAALPPQPPEHNPHPPQTEADQRRVRFAEQAVKIFFQNPLPATLKTFPLEETPPFASKNLDCLKEVSCYKRDMPFVNQILGFQERYGRVVEFRHPHVIPWSMENFLRQKKSSPAMALPPSPSGRAAMRVPDEAMGPSLRSDEYMVHTYVRFSKAGGWYHLDVILSEDEKGNISLRSFYTTPMVDHQLPPGVVCMRAVSLSFQAG